MSLSNCDVVGVNGGYPKVFAHGYHLLENNRFLASTQSISADGTSQLGVEILASHTVSHEHILVKLLS